MTASIQQLLHDIEIALRDAGRRLELPPPAPAELVKKCESKIGCTFTAGMRELWQFCNGSPCMPLLCHSPGSTYGFMSLLPIERAYKERNKRNYTWDYHGGYPTNCDPKIKFWFFEHQHWFPIGYYPLGADGLFFDAAPGPEGVEGQIIEWDAAEDEIYFVANSIESVLAETASAIRRFHGDEPEELEHMFDHFEVPKC